MTSVFITFGERIEKIEVRGHAGFAAKGEDIVCSGISSLTFAAGNAFLGYKIPAKIDQDEKNTAFVISPRWSDMTEKEELRAETILQSLVWALEDLAKSYGEFVKLSVVRRC